MNDSILPAYPDTKVASLKSEQGGFSTSSVTLEPVDGMSICDLNFIDIEGRLIAPSYILATCSSRFDGASNGIAFRYAVCPDGDLNSATLFSSDFTSGLGSNVPYFSSTQLLLTRGIDYVNSVVIRLTETTEEEFFIPVSAGGVRNDVCLQFIP
jgi:hypothetical protein